MEVAILMLVIFLFTDIMVVGICMLAYAGKEEYSGGMLFGVHIPKEKVDEKTVRDMAETYKKKYKKFQRMEHDSRDIGVWGDICWHWDFYDCLDCLAHGIYCRSLLDCLWDTPKDV